MGFTVTSQTAHGPVDWYYVLSTPKKLLAQPDELDKRIPTLLILIPGFSLLVSAHPQFRDPRLRRFNLITFDYLGHGRTEGKVPESYSIPEVALDVSSFIDALHLPPLFVLGIGMGGRYATQLAIDFPEKVKGLFLASTHSGTEVPAVAAGRSQVFQLWAEAMARIDRGESGPEIEELLESVHYGANQLAWGSWNAGPNPTSAAMSHLSFNACRTKWNHANIRAAQTVSLDMAIHSKPFTMEHYTRVKVPVEIIYGLSDIAYKPEQYEEFADGLRNAGVDVRRVTTVEGAPQFLSTTHEDVLNPLVEAFVDSLWVGDAAPTVSPPEGRTSMHSPFEEDLTSVGWEDEEMADEVEHR